MRAYIPFKPFVLLIVLNLCYNIYVVFTGDAIAGMICFDVNFICLMILFAKEYRDGYR